jgi:hypothetical protein
MAKQKFTQEQVITAVKETKGLVYLAAKKLGCDPETVNNYANRYPKVRATINNARAEVVDVAEAKLYAALLGGAPWAVLFALKTQGKDRGYVEKVQQEVSGEAGGPLRIEVIYADHPIDPAAAPSGPTGD